MTRRRDLDFYPTASWATEALLARVPITGRVLEPCVGRGDIARVIKGDDLRGHRVWVYTNDLDRHHVADEHEDARDRGWWSRVRDRLEPEWVVTNPPFSVAHEILPLAFATATKGVAMLLRITYLEPCEGRAGWLAAHPPDKLIVLPRISFTGDGSTDLATCAWFVWSQEGNFGNKIDEMWPPIEIVTPPALEVGRMFADESTRA